MSTEAEPTPYTTIYHVTDARARCIAYRVVRQVLEQMRTAGGDLEAALERAAADQEAADGAWEATLAEWDRQRQEGAEEFAAWRASIKDRPLGKHLAALNRQSRGATPAARAAPP